MEAKGTGFSWRKALSPQIYLAFFSALLFGMLAHGMGLWNKLSWHDDIVSLFWEGSTISSGRWMLHVLGWLEKLIFEDGHFSLPVTNGLFALICISISAGLLVHLFEIQKKSLCIGLGCIMAAFPSVTGLFGYMFTIHYYMLAMGMMVVCAVMICSEKRKWLKLPAVLLGGCSMGIYQAFFPMLLCILLLYDLLCLTERDEKISVFLQRAAIQVLCVLGVAAFYFAMNHLFLHKYALHANTYMGIDQMSSTPVQEYLSRAGAAWLAFFRPARYTSADMYPVRAYYTYLIMLFTGLLLSVRQGLRLWRNSRGKALLFFLLLLLLPLCNNFIYVMSAQIHGLMTYSQVMQVVVFVWLADRAVSQPPRSRKIQASTFRRAISVAAAAILGLTSVLYARFDNQCYLKAIFQQQQAISFFTALAAQIKAAPGFKDDTPVVFLNEGTISDRTLYNISELDFIHLDPYGETLQEYVNSYGWRAFMERWCGFGPVWADPADYADLPEVKAMPHYPDDGSIRKWGEVILVNF